MVAIPNPHELVLAALPVAIPPNTPRATAPDVYDIHEPYSTPAQSSRRPAEREEDILQLHTAPLAWKFGGLLLLLDAFRAGYLAFQTLSRPSIDTKWMIAAVVVAFLMTLLALGLFVGTPLAKWATILLQSAAAAGITAVVFKGIVELRNIPRLRFVHDPKWLLVAGAAALILGWLALLRARPTSSLLSRGCYCSWPARASWSGCPSMFIFNHALRGVLPTLRASLQSPPCTKDCSACSWPRCWVLRR